MQSGPALRIAVDIGGTFTDLVLEVDGVAMQNAKVLTTPHDPSEAVADGVASLLVDRDPRDLIEIVHGTTLVPNALIERKGVRTALLTTAGFRDILQMGREQRYDLYDLQLEMPLPLVDRRLRIGVRERVRADGSVDIPLDPSEVRALAGPLRDAQVRSVAICFLHAYRRPEHELAARDALRAVLPEISISISSEVAPELGEYHRVSTTVANAYVQPVIDRYLATMADRLRAAGIEAPVRIMLSNGGLASLETARQFPIQLLESGPAAGVLSAGYAVGPERDVLAFDMGGTTAKAALIEHGEPVLTREHEAARIYRFVRGSGLPIKVPVIDMIEIGAGGGSIARAGIFGLPKVGPDSTSSVPGPACYGLGGTDPSVTDADLLLGYLAADRFLGGTMPLDVDAAERVMANLGAQLGLDALQTAAAIHRVVNENMASAARMHAIERGRDVRRFVLTATGGAGPVHAWGVARALGIRHLVFPPRAGVASAFGMLTAPTSFEFARSIPGALASTDWAFVASAIDDMVDHGRRQLAASGMTPESVVIALDARFLGQGATLTIPLGDALPAAPERAVELGFLNEYQRLYGARPGDVELEVITWRVRVASRASRPDVNAPFEPAGSTTAQTRRMWFAETDGFVEGAVHRRSALAPGFRCQGPAVFEEPESTIVVGPGASISITERGNLEVVIDG